MSEPIKFRHVVSLAGVVREQPIGNNGNDKQAGVEIGRLAEALVQIIVDEAPQAFQTRIKALKADPAWASGNKRIDRAISQADGVFFFVDLPAGEAGETYRLRISMPQRATRYGTVETEAVAVNPNEPGEPVQVTQMDVTLPVTQISGTVSKQNGDAIPGAKVHLRGATRFVETQGDGGYRLSHLLAGKPLLEVTAAKFETFQQRVALTAGQTLEIDVHLTAKAE